MVPISAPGFSPTTIKYGKDTPTTYNNVYRIKDGNESDD